MSKVCHLFNLSTEDVNHAVLKGDLISQKMNTAVCVLFVLAEYAWKEKVPKTSNYCEKKKNTIENLRLFRSC